MLASGHGFDRPFRVKRDRKRDVDCIDVFLSNHFIVAAVGAWDVVAFGVSLGFSEGAGGDSDDDNVGMRLGWVVEVNGSEGGCSEDAKVDRAGRLLDRELVEFCSTRCGRRGGAVRVRKSRPRMGEYAGSESAGSDERGDIP